MTSKTPVTMLAAALSLVGTVAFAQGTKPAAPPAPAPAPAAPAAKPAAPAPAAPAPAAPAPAAPAAPAAAAPAAKPAAPAAPAAAAPAAKPAPTAVGASPAAAPGTVAPAAPAAAPALPAPPAPKPAPELDQAKWVLGAWRCDGKAPIGALGPNSPAFDYKSTITLKKDLNNFAITAEYQQKKTKVNPAGYHAKGLITYDGAQKKFVVMGVDSTGGFFNESGGPDGPDKIVSEGQATMAGQKMTIRETFTKTGDKTISWRGEVKTPGAKDWQTVGEDNCKK